TIDPDLGVVVDGGLEDHRRAAGVVGADAFRNSQVDAIPVETEPAGRAALIESSGADRFPFRIVEIGGAGVRRVVVGPDRGAGRLAVRPRPAEIDLDDFGVAVAPLALDEARAFAGRQI